MVSPLRNQNSEMEINSEIYTLNLIFSKSPSQTT